MSVTALAPTVPAAFAVEQVRPGGLVSTCTEYEFPACTPVGIEKWVALGPTRRESDPFVSTRPLFAPRPVMEPLTVNGPSEHVTAMSRSACAGMVPAPLFTAQTAPEG